MKGYLHPHDDSQPKSTIGTNPSVDAGCSVFRPFCFYFAQIIFQKWADSGGYSGTRIGASKANAFKLTRRSGSGNPSGIRLGIAILVSLEVTCAALPVQGESPSAQTQTENQQLRLVGWSHPISFGSRRSFNEKSSLKPRSRSARVLRNNFDCIDDWVVDHRREREFDSASGSRLNIVELLYRRIGPAFRHDVEILQNDAPIAGDIEDAAARSSAHQVVFAEPWLGEKQRDTVLPW